MKEKKKTAVYYLLEYKFAKTSWGKYMVEVLKIDYLYVLAIPVLGSYTKKY